MSKTSKAPRASYHLQGEILHRLTELERRVDEMGAETRTTPDHECLYRNQVALMMLRDMQGRLGGVGRIADEIGKVKRVLQGGEL